MVCKNCGADLKPGIKYCLECGSYIDEEEEEETEELSDEDKELSTDYAPVELGEEVPKKKKKRKKLNLTTTDYLIYAGLLIVMIGSIIVIIVSLIKNNNQPAQESLPTVETVEADRKVTVDNYSVVIPGKLTSTIQDTVLYVSDNTNYTFSFQINEDDFDAYVADHNLIEKKITNKSYEVTASNEKTVNNRIFIIYNVKNDNSTKTLYLTKANSKYVTMGIIEELPNGNWENALSVIDTIVNSINFQFE